MWRLIQDDTGLPDHLMTEAVILKTNCKIQTYFAILKIPVHWSSEREGRLKIPGTIQLVSP